jgi:hypothetical protein
MWDFLLSGDNVPFMAALVLMVLIGIVEAIGLGGGLGVGDAPDGFDSDLDAPSLLSWLNVGRLPLLMLVVVFLFVFGKIGLLGQQVFAAITGRPASWLFAVPVAIAAALPVTRVLGRWLSKILPQDETTAVSRASLVGRTAIIVTGEARRDHAAQARVRDRHGQAHYVMVEPDRPADVFAEGTSVLLIRSNGARYFAVRDTSTLLTV